MMDDRSETTTKDNYSVIDVDFDTVVAACYPFAISVSYMDEWVPVKYAISEDAAEKYVKSFNKDNNALFSVHHNVLYNPDAKRQLLNELDELREAISQGII